MSKVAHTGKRAKTFAFEEAQKISENKANLRDYSCLHVNLLPKNVLTYLINHPTNVTMRTTKITKIVKQRKAIKQSKNNKQMPTGLCIFRD